MKVEMLMPQMGESITEATILKWKKNIGEFVNKDEIILEISTDKVDSELPSPSSGVLIEVLFQEGDVVPVKQKIAVIDSSQTQSSAVTPDSSKKADQKLINPSNTQSIAPAGDNKTSTGKVFSPLVKSLAEQNNVPLKDLEAIEGSGQGGRVNKQDFMEYLSQKSEPQPSSVPVSQQVNIPQHSPASKSVKVPNSGPVSLNEWGEDGTKIIPMDSMRRAIADHMVMSKHTSPHVYSVQEVDITQVSKWRAKYKDLFKKSEGFNLTFTPFFLEATVKALGKFQYINSSVSEKKIILKRNINLGCAVALENQGLIVPVIKKAEEKNLVGLARSLNELALKARNRKLVPDEVSGGTFTVTNVGGFGTVIGTPIINQPQVAILCIGAIQKKPVVINDMIAIRETCYLTLSYDHRVIDGALSGQFLAFIREYLENWDSERSFNN
jgi:2-oxoglutarate dehydrogenase E2 component (dihydrolipoamide succinyltransferase)